jgi:predicted HTH domain antitoxin
LSVDVRIESTYKKGEASLGRAAELAGLPIGQMITILTFGVESRLEKEDYLQGIRNLHKYGDNSREMELRVNQCALAVPFGDIK